MVYAIFSWYKSVYGRDKTYRIGLDRFLSTIREAMKRENLKIFRYNVYDTYTVYNAAIRSVYSKEIGMMCDGIKFFAVFNGV